MNKAAIEKFAVWARTKLISEITYKAGLIGITEKGIAEALPQSTSDLKLFDIGTKNYAEVSGTAIKQREALVKEIKHREKDSNYKTAFDSVVEEVAYTWFNRLIAIRFMEVNDYLPSRVRVLSSENPAKSEPDFVTNPFDTDLTFTPYEQDRIVQLKDENKLDELFRMLFIKQCNKLHEILPELFERTDDYTELLLTISFTDKDGVVYHLTHDIKEDDFDIAKEGQVEIIGWMYQYYNTELKADTFAQLKKNVKISKERIPAATQLFTPDWIVRYMVENSLGRLWVEGHPNDALKSEWKYYLDEAEQEVSVQAELAKIKAEHSRLNPEDIKVIDPCMGSGHILVYAFDVLMQIYESCGYTQRDAARSIIANNLFGLDIDKRAYQLSYFALMMKARQYNRRILSDGLKPNVFAIADNSVLTNDTINYIAKGNPKIKKDLITLADDLYNAKEYGSIIDVTPVDFKAIYDRLEEMRNGELDIFSAYIPEQVTPIIHQAEVMAKKYDIVVTNPPYMGSSGMSSKLTDYVKNYYPNSKADLFSVFMQRADQMVKSYGYTSLITMESWMFLSSFEKLREIVNTTKTIINMVHMPYLGKGGTSLGINFGTAAVVMMKNRLRRYKAQYEYTVYYECDKDGVPFEFPTKNERWNTACQESFCKIPGSPVAYWVSKPFIDAFDRGISIDDISDYTGSQNKTANNDLYLRKFWEVNKNKTGINKQWIFYAKGGDFRKHYGNLELVVNWSETARNFYKTNPTSNLLAEKYWYQEGITYTMLTSKGPNFRYMPPMCAFDMGGPAICYLSDNLHYVLAFLNSRVATEYLDLFNPTLNLQAKDVKALPLLLDNERKSEIEQLESSCVKISRLDWDAFETSWDFVRHPLAPSARDKRDQEDSQFSSSRMEKFGRIAWLYENWERECADRFATLKANEEELNRIFIDIYGLQDELTPEVEEKDVTVRRADLQRDIKSFMSYAVGCMLGRYSLDVDGLTYAGDEWDSSKYQTFIPDADNCLPITDEEYFHDDIVGRFVEFVKTVYGATYLEENLNFIAKALGNKGNTSREIVRNYFLNDFINDHIKMYQKRPIYWMFDSGKQNGFKALVYMHRWNADTIGNMRVEYLHRMQRVYESEIARMQETIDNSTNNREVSAAEKRKDKLMKQLKETKDYDTKIAHLALSRIDIDLDDGVKVNYEKVQTPPAGKKIDILTKIK